MVMKTAKSLMMARTWREQRDTLFTSAGAGSQNWGQKSHCTDSSQLILFYRFFYSFFCLWLFPWCGYEYKCYVLLFSTSPFCTIFLCRSFYDCCFLFGWFMCYIWLNICIRFNMFLYNIFLYLNTLFYCMLETCFVPYTLCSDWSNLRVDSLLLMQITTTWAMSVFVCISCLLCFLIFIWQCLAKISVRSKYCCVKNMCTLLFNYQKYSVAHLLSDFWTS